MGFPVVRARVPRRTRGRAVNICDPASSGRMLKNRLPRTPIPQMGGRVVGVMFFYEWAELFSFTPWKLPNNIKLLHNIKRLLSFICVYTWGYPRGPPSDNRFEPVEPLWKNLITKKNMEYFSIYLPLHPVNPDLTEKYNVFLFIKIYKKFIYLVPYLLRTGFREFYPWMTCQLKPVLGSPIKIRTYFNYLISLYIKYGYFLSVI